MSATSLIKIIRECANRWVHIPDKNDLKMVEPLYFEVVQAFEANAEAQGIRPPIYIRDGSRWLAYGKARCIARICDKGANCSFAMSDLEHQIHPFCIRETLRDHQSPDTPVLIKFLDSFTYWVNHTFTKVWDSGQRSAPLARTVDSYKARSEPVRAPESYFAPKGSSLPPEKTAAMEFSGEGELAVFSKPEDIEGAELPLTMMIDKTKYYVQNAVTFDPEMEKYEYREFDPEIGIEAQVGHMGPSILGFLNHGEGSLLIGFRHLKISLHGHGWQVQGFHPMFLDKLLGAIVTMTRGYLPTNKAQNNYKHIVHPVCKKDGTPSNIVVAELKFERKPDNHFHIFLPRDSMVYLVRTPGAAPIPNGSVLMILQYYQMKIQNAESSEEKQDWQEARDHLIREIDARLGEALI